MKPGDVSIGVGIPSYNHGRFLGETIRSVLRQTWAPAELLVIDDGSSDDSVAEIEKAFSEAGPVRCRLVVRENRGISATRNELLAGLNTEVVALLDSDDRYREDRFERMLAPIPAGEPFFAISGVDFESHLSAEETTEWTEFYAEMLRLASRLPTAGFALLRSNFAITASNFVFSRRLLDEMEWFDPRILVCQDWDFLLRAVRLVEPRFCAERLVTYRLHPLGTAKNNPHRFEEVRLVYDKLACWLEGVPPNSRAPVPANWPGYLRYFSSVCSNLAAHEPLGAVLPSGFLAGEQTLRPDGRQALRELLAACAEGEQPEAAPISELLRRCERAWRRE